MRTSALLVAVCFAFGMPTQILAQELPLFTDSLHDGLRVRVHAPGVVRLPTVTGTITHFHPEGFYFKADYDGGVRFVPIERIRGLEVSTERGVTRGRLVAGAGLGFLAGLGLARLLDARAQERTECSLAIECVNGRSLLIGTITGTGIGLAVAALKPGEMWRSVRLH